MYNYIGRWWIYDDAGVISVSIGEESDRLQVMGEGVDSVRLANSLRKKFCYAEIISVGEVEAAAADADASTSPESTPPPPCPLKPCPAQYCPPPPYCPQPPFYYDYRVYDPAPPNCSIFWFTFSTFFIYIIWSKSYHNTTVRVFFREGGNNVIVIVRVE